MKNKLFLFAFLSLITFVGFSQGIDTTAVAEEVTILETTNEVIQVATQDSTAVITPPSPFDPTNPSSLFQWWMYIYALLMPLGTYIFNKFFPSASKRELIIKSTSIAVVVLMLIIAMKGMSAAAVGQAILAFIFQTITYDKGYKGIGMSSPRAKNYNK